MDFTAEFDWLMDLAADWWGKKLYQIGHSWQDLKTLVF